MHRKLHLMFSILMNHHFNSHLQKIMTASAERSDVPQVSNWEFWLVWLLHYTFPRGKPSFFDNHLLGSQTPTWAESHYQNKPRNALIQYLTFPFTSSFPFLCIWTSDTRLICFIKVFFATVYFISYHIVCESLCMVYYIQSCTMN